MKGIKNSLKKLSRSYSKPSQTSGEKDVLIDKNAKRVNYLESFPKVLVYRGHELPGDIIFSKVLDDLQDLDVRESDIFIVSYPQSGSSAVEDIIVKVVDKVNEQKVSARRHRPAQVARLEAGNPYGHIRWLNGLRSPRIFTTNLPLDLLPQQLKENTVCKVIYLLRNPKDQAVSYYYHHRVKSILSSFNDFVDLYMSGHLLYGQYFSHVIDFIQLSHLYPKNVFLLSYEEIKLERYAMTKLLVDFLEFQLTDEELLKITNDFPTNVAESGVKVHNFEGVIGDWMNYFSPEQSRQMDELVKSRFGSLGLSLCFDPTEATKRLSKFGRIIIQTKSVSKSENKSKTKSIVEKTKVGKDEYVLLRNQSLSKIEVISSETETAQVEVGCCARFGSLFMQGFRMCCQCFYKNHKKIV